MIDPVALTFGNLQVRWYGILMALAFLIGAYLAGRLAPKRGLTKQNVYDFLVYLIPFSIVGARIGHVLSDTQYYFSNPAKILAIWNGGLASYGAFVGGIIAVYWYTKKNKIDFYDLADTFVIPLSLGLAIGRIGNFINQELYGKITTLPWGVEFDGVNGRRHPSQFYHSLKDLFIFVVLSNLNKNVLPKGFLFWLFFLMYTFLRFFLDFLRDIERPFLNLTYAQLLFLPFFFVSLFMFVKIRKIKKHLDDIKVNE